MKYLSLIALLCLSACGGGSSSEKPVTPTEPPVVVAPLVDSFYRAVNTVVGAEAETSTEPDDIASAAITEPEDSEPVAL